MLKFFSTLPNGILWSLIHFSSTSFQLSSSSMGHTVFDRRNFSSQFTERQRVHPESIGPEFEQIFLVSNLGPSPVENIWVNLSVPLQTESGDFLVYLLDLIRTQNTGGGPPLQIPVTPDVCWPCHVMTNVVNVWLNSELQVICHIILAKKVHVFEKFLKSDEFSIPLPGIKKLSCATIAIFSLFPPLW